MRVSGRRLPVWRRFILTRSYHTDHTPRLTSVRSSHDAHARDAFDAFTQQQFRVAGDGYEEDQKFESSVVLQLSTDGKTLIVYPRPNGLSRVRCLTPDFPGPELEKKMLEDRKRQ